MYGWFCGDWITECFPTCASAGVPPSFRLDGPAPQLEAPPCVLEKLCELHDGLVVEAKGIKQHYFKPYIHKLFHKQVEADH